MEVKGKVNSKMYLIAEQLEDVNSVKKRIIQTRKITQWYDESSGYYPKQFKSINGMLSTVLRKGPNASSTGKSSGIFFSLTK